MFCGAPAELSFSDWALQTLPYGSWATADQSTGGGLFVPGTANIFGNIKMAIFEYLH